MLQSLHVHVLSAAHSIEEITVLSPLIAKRATEVTSLGRDQLDHGGNRQLEGFRSYRLFEKSSPNPLSSPVAPVHPSKMQVVRDAIKHNNQIRVLKIRLNPRARSFRNSFDSRS